jgi:hypothetical protein
MQGIEAATIVESKVESAMDRYFYKFNLTGLNDLLSEELYSDYRIKQEITG